MSSPIDPSLLNEWLADAKALVVDIRPHAAYVAARIPRAVSLSVPSTLLKRPLFSLDKLAAMLPSVSARTRFSAWPTASRILVYDADSASAPDSSNLAGLLRKFKADGFHGELAWLRGGFQAVWRDHRELLDTSPPSPDIGMEDEDEDGAKASVLRPRHLPMAAFSLSSTTIHNSPLFINNNSTNNKSLAFIAPQPSHPNEIENAAPAGQTHPAFNPFFDTIRQNTELSHGITDRIPLRLPHRVRRRMGDLPFGWLQDIAKRAANAPRRHRTMTNGANSSMTSSSSSSSSESEDEETGARAAEIEEGKEALAMQFFKIELSEQRRLMGVMEHHSKESGQPVEHNAAVFPYSITAGVEKGAKNRYRHIWPFEHARVRLHRAQTGDDDYVNASYIQPLATAKRYIATQGPLPATFTDFWTLCWEQNVHVIVMLTREVEGAMVKCGTYWSDTRYGPLRLRLLSTEGLAKEDERPSTAGFFANLAAYSAHPPPSPAPRLPHTADNHRRPRGKHQHQHSKRVETVKRVFELSNTAYPDAPPRKIVHLQYLEWPDMNVPDDPRGVLGLIKQVEEAVEDTQRTADEAHPSESKKRRRKGPNAHEEGIDEKTGVAKHMLGGNHPLLLHCSAGVGRTGGFIVVDAILDAIRRELRSKTAHPEEKKEEEEGDKMDVRPDTQPDSSGSELPSPFASGKTMQWAENVRDETGIDGASNGPVSAPAPAPAPAPAATPQSTNLASPLSLSYTGRTASTSTSTGSSETRHNGSSGASVNNANGSYYYTSSSSVGTSVSGSSSSSSSAFSFKAGFPITAVDSAPTAATTTTKMKTKKTAEMLHAALNYQQEQRLRTMSAPAPAPPSRESSMMDVHQGRSSTMPQPAKAQASMDMDVDVSDGDGEGDVDGDGSPPSRSQSPSADESASPSKPGLLRTSSSRPTEELHRQPSSPHSNSRPSSFSLSLSSPNAQPAAAATAATSPFTAHAHKTAFDYKSPRALHEDRTPPPLTAFDDPIWEVVQDVREQRMSLCQSLRQYVFVHAAVVEGALMVVDEEKERERMGGLGMGGWKRKDGDGDGKSTGPSSDVKRSKSKSHSHSRSPTKRPSNTPIQARQPQSGKTTTTTHPYSTFDAAFSSSLSVASSSSSSSSPSIGNGSSPTDTRQNMKEVDIAHDHNKGINVDVSLAPVPSPVPSPAEGARDISQQLLKRPSVKRKQRSGDDLSHLDAARYHPVPARVVNAAGGGVNAPSVPSVPSVRSMPP